MSDGRVLLPIGRISSNADISGAVDFVTMGLFHDWFKVVPALYVGAQDTPVDPGNIVDPGPTPTAGGCTEVFISVEERSRTDDFDFVTADVLDEVSDEANGNGVCDL